MRFRISIIFLTVLLLQCSIASRYIFYLRLLSTLMHFNGVNVCYMCYNRQDAQLSQRDRAAGCVIVFAKSRRLEVELGDNILLIL